MALDKIKIRKVEDKVKEVLKESYEARDNDMLLIARIWATEINIYNLNNMIVYDFFRLMSAYDLSHATSIIRCRQKIQELYPQYRGDKYKKRHKKMEPEVRKEIKTWKKESQQLNLINGEKQDYEYP
tara:strand:+ start:1603 stop:1983 length:381 start_codon:yes stop_codon:yes gene_type:complete